MQPNAARVACRRAAAFFRTLKGKTGLTAARATALCINTNTEAIRSRPCNASARHTTSGSPGASSDLGSQPLPQRRWKCGSHGHSLHKVTPRWRWKWGTQAAKKEVTSHAGLGVAMRTAAFTPVRFFAQRLVFSDLALSSSLSSIQS